MARRGRRGIVDPQEEMRGVANSAKTLLANIRFLSVDDPVRTIVITSAVPGEGKTFVSANLASAIATSGETVLLVECDLRRRSMATQLGVHARHGLYSVVSGEVGLLEAVIAANIPNLYFLDAEPHIPNPSDLLNSNRFSEMLQYVSLAFDYVIFDTPPVGTFIDAAVLGAKVDAVFMVVRENFTRRADLKAATEQLSKSGCDLAGVVMNFCESRDSGYYYDYYYSYHRKSDDHNAPRIGVAQTRPVLDASAGLGQAPQGVPQWMTQNQNQRVAQPQPAVQPIPQPTPQPQPVPQPAAQPVPQPAAQPQPVPQPSAQPVPQPAEQPQLQSKPAVQPQVAQQQPYQPQSPQQPAAYQQAYQPQPYQQAQEPQHFQQSYQQPQEPQPYQSQPPQQPLEQQPYQQTPYQQPLEQTPYQQTPYQQPLEPQPYQQSPYQQPYQDPSQTGFIPPVETPYEQEEPTVYGQRPGGYDNTDYLAYVDRVPGQDL